MSDAQKNLLEAILALLLPICIHPTTIYGSLLLGAAILLASLINAIAMKAAGTTSFPQSLAASVVQYCKSFRDDPLEVQHNLLMAAIMPGERKRYIYKNMQVKLSGRDRVINSVKITKSQSSSIKRVGKRTIFVLHGYGSGLAFFFKVFPALLQHGDYEIHAPDWLGMGNSSRPDFRVPANLDAEDSRKWVEAWFIDSLEEYRQRLQLDKVTILAHSFGAYLAVRYAQKYAQSVEQLLLISPVAVNKNPYDVALTRLVQDPPKTAIPAVYRAEDENKVTTVRGSAQSEHKVNPLPRFIVALWEAHWTPFDFLRIAGPFGPKLCSSWSLNLPIPPETYPSTDSTRLLVHQYAYSIFAAPASSERALSYILVAGGHARNPLEDSVPQDIPVCLIYGKNDWMSSAAGFRAAKKCNARGGQCNVVLLNRGGHLSFLEAFPELIENIHKELERA